MIKQILLEFDTSTNQPIPRMPLNQYPMGAVPGIKDQIDDHVKRNWLKYLMAAGMLGRSAHQKYGNFNANATKLQQMQANHAQLSNALKNPVFVSYILASSFNFSLLLTYKYSLGCFVVFLKLMGMVTSS